MIEPAHPKLPVTEQCQLLGLPRSSYYHRPLPESDENQRLMRVIDEMYLAQPFFGSRQMTRWLRRQGHAVNRKRVQRLMRLMGLETIYRKPNLSRKHPAHPVFPYLRRRLAIERPNQVWATDITYVPIHGGFIYLCAVIDWHSRAVLAWELSNNPNVRDHAGGTPLLIAANNGHDAFIEALVQAGTDINLGNATGQRALHRAALAGHVGTARTLLRLGADPNLADNHGWTALHWAAACPVRASLDLLQVLVEAGARADVPDREGMTPLHVAAANLVSPGLHARQRQPVALHYINARRLKVLVDAGAGVNDRDSAGRTALHWAAWLGETMYGEDVGNRPFFEYRTEAVRYLLAAGADPAFRDNAGKTAAEYAAAEGYTETVSFLNSAAALPWLAGRGPSDVRGELPAEETAAQGQMPSPASRRLMRAVATGDLAGVQAALVAGANPNQFGLGGSPLHRAVIEGHLEIVRALVAAGAEVALRDSDGYTPYERAMQNNDTEIAEALQATPAKPAAQ